MEGELDILKSWELFVDSVNFSVLLFVEIFFVCVYERL